MRKERVLNLETECQVREFINNINEDFYYIDFDNETWKGKELKAAIEYEENYDAFVGSYKEIEPYEFFYVEEEENGYGGSWVCDVCSDEKESFSLMVGNWNRLVKMEKRQKTTSAYRCYGIPEHIECHNDAVRVGFATMYRNREYISYKDVSSFVISWIDNDLSGEISPAFIVFDGCCYFYEKEVDGVRFKVEVSRTEWEDGQEVFLENRVEIFA